MQMMRNTAIKDHLTIAEILPDFVLGKLDETSLRRVSRHLDDCHTCRDEYANAIEILGSLAAVPPPPACLRGSILRRAAATPPVIGQLAVHRPTAPQRTASADSIVRLLSNPARQPGTPFGRPLPRWAVAVASLLVFLVASVAGIGFVYQNMANLGATSPDQRIQTLISDPAAAFPLDDSDLPVSATGVVFAEPNARDVYLVANGLPQLPRDQRYQVWLYTIDDETISAGQVTAEAGGEVRALLQTPDPFADYVGVGLTAEPEQGSTSPTSEMVLGGSFPPLSASLPADSTG